jgi:DNA-binding SARP family transcriptional activator/tetratricopeptide (TPR) repeat protein
MEFRLLGTLEVGCGDRELALGGPRQQSVLAALALRANETVGVNYLSDAVWQCPPASLRANIRTYITNLRRVLCDADGSRLIGTPSGYRLLVRPGESDVELFENHVDQATRAQWKGATVEAIDLYDRALALWRERPALRGLTLGSGLEAAVAGLDERWFQAMERRIQCRLATDVPGDTVGELRVLVAEHPLRESLTEMLMWALHRSGRTAEALDVFQRSYRQVVEQLGIEPGPRLQRLQQLILSGSPVETPTGAGGPAVAVAPASPGTAAFELPPATARFTGRQAELGGLDRLLERTATEPVVASVSGPAGVGKTALVLRWAHAVADRFPDGQLYVDLGGYGTARPVSTEEALERILRSAGVPPDQIPAEDDARRRVYRSAVTGRRLLLVLDNVRSAEQVRPLLPGVPGCLVVVTSRDALVGLAALDGARPVNLAPLREEESLALLAALIDDDRVRAEPAALADLARLCAHLPLALRIAAARLAIQPHHPVHALVRRLGRDALGVLRSPDDPPAAVRTAFDHSYVLLGEAARRLFRRLALAPGSDLAAPVAAALMDEPVETVERLLDELTCAHLADEHRPGRYRQHDLLRQYAAELAAAEDPDEERRTAIHRSITWYLAAAAQATEVLDPHRRRDLPFPLGTPGDRPLVLTDHDEALAWCEAERGNLVAAVYQAIEYGRPDLAWQLPVALFGFFELRKYWADWLGTHAMGLDAARQVHARSAEAWMLNSLGIAEKQLGRYERAIDRYRAALAIRQETGDRHGEAVTLNNLGTAANRTGRSDEAIAHYGQALAVFRETGDRWGEGLVLTNLGEAHRSRGAYESALLCFTEALAIRRFLGDRRGEGIVVNNLANTVRALGRYSEAIHSYRQALRLRHSVGDRWGVARTLTNLGTVLEEVGRPVPARRCWRWALEIFHELGDGQVDQVRALLDQEPPKRRSTMPSSRSASTYPKCRES